MQHVSPQRPSRLADHEVLPRLASLVERDRATTCEMLVLIGRAEARRLYAPTEYPSMFRYCVGRLRMSEDMAYKRIRASRAARKFPAILALLADGRLHLSGVLPLAPYLTTSNAAELLAAAALRTRAALEQLLAARFPRPDLAALVRPLPPAASPGQQAPGPVGATPPEAFSRALPAMDPGAIAGVSLAVESPAGSSRVGSEAPEDIMAMACQLAPGPVAPPAPVAPPDQPAKITPLAPGRFGVQLTIGQAAHEKLRYAQALASHAVPGGALAEIFERALDAFIARLEKQKFAATSRPRPASKRPSADPRHVPAAVVREVCLRDMGRCTFMTENAQRCESRDFLELDHVTPVAKGGESTVANVRLRCHTHNQYEAERVFGTGFMDRKRAEARRRAASKQATSRAAAAERARRERYARDLADNAAAQARALEAMPWLQRAGVRPDEASAATDESRRREGPG